MVSPTPQGGGDVGARPTLIQSVQRALRLIEVIAEHGGRARAKEIARAAGLPLGTTYHLLRTCAHEGWLQRLDDGSYVLGHRIDVVRESGTAARGVAHARPAPSTATTTGPAIRCTTTLRAPSSSAAGCGCPRRMTWPWTTASTHWASAAWRPR
jgi:IclR helix-turn-helix domain